MNIFNSSIIAHKQCIPHVAQAQRASYLQKFSRHDVLHAFVCKLGCDLYHRNIPQPSPVHESRKITVENILK